MEFRPLDLFTFTELPKVDIVHIRFVLSHFLNRRELLQRLIIKAPKTRFIIEEIGQDLVTEPDPDYKIWRDGAKIQFGLDPSVDLLQELIKQGYKVLVQGYQPYCSGKLHAMGVKSVLNKRPELLSLDQATELMASLNRKTLPHFTLVRLDFTT